MQEIISRKDALAKGLKRYFTGEPCKFGHISEKTVCGCECYECVKVRWHNYSQNNKEKRRLQRAAYYQANKEYFAAHSKKKTEQNPLLHRIAYAKRKARKLESGGHFSIKDIEKILFNQKHKCVECKVSLENGYHVDHIKPLSKGGSNWPSNLQCLCARCNLSKSDKDPFDWAQEKGRLL